MCRNLPWRKLQAFIKMQITRNQPKTFRYRRIFRELNNVTLAEPPSKLIGQTLVLTCSLRVGSLHTLFVRSVCRSTSVSTGTSNKQILSTKSRTCWSQSSRHGGGGGLSPQNNAPSPPNWNMNNYKSVEFCQFLVSRPPVEDFLATVLGGAQIYRSA